MSKAKRQARQQNRQAKAAVARQQRTARKTARQVGHTNRVQQRADSKMDRQAQRQAGRADNLKVKIQNRAKQIKDEKEAASQELENAANQTGQDVQNVAQDRIENNPVIKGQLRQYVSTQTDTPLEEISEDASELANQAVLLRGEEIEDVRGEINSEIEGEGDTFEEEFENFEFYEAACFENEKEFPESFEGYGVLDPSTWATVSGAAKGGLEVIASNQFKKGKKFLGKTEAQWKAPADPNSASEVIYKEATEGYKSNFVKDNMVVIIIIVIAIIGLGFFAFKGASSKS